jgi:hypothetical protein
MPDLTPESPPESSSDSKDISKKEVTVQISYCPSLGLYHYKRFDGEYFFDGEQLEISLETYLRDGKNMDSEFMAKLTSWARVFPHKIVTFFSDLTFEVRDPVVASLDDEPVEPQKPEPSSGE